ncbi:hypothetical protein ACVXG7_11120 [Enterobacter hormaechei]
MRQFAFNVFTRADEVLGVVVVLFDAGRDGEDVRVEDDVFRRKPTSSVKILVRAAANLNLALAGIGLTDFIEGHHHHGGPVATHQLRVVDKVSTPFIEIELTMPCRTHFSPF